MTNETTTEIDWKRAMADAEWLAGSTADTAERNLAMAYLAVRRAEMENVIAWQRKQREKESLR
jgi:hypothetical protein